MAFPLPSCSANATFAAVAMEMCLAHCRTNLGETLNIPVQLAQKRCATVILKERRHLVAVVLARPISPTRLFYIFRRDKYLRLVPFER